MLIILSQREYDELVRRATASDALAEEKAERFKAEIMDRLRAACKEAHFTTSASFAARITEILRQY